MRSLKEIFIDSSGFFAFLVHRDPAHPAARGLFQILHGQKRRSCTTDHVIAETLTLLRARGQNHLCHTFYNIVQNTPSLHIAHTSEDIFAKAAAFFLRHSDKGYSFTDCVSFVVMREKKLTDALTTDVHFAQAGFKSLLAA